MVSEDFLKKTIGKKVHVEYVKDDEECWNDGILADYNTNFVSIENETDSDTISITDIRKVWIRSDSED